MEEQRVDVTIGDNTVVKKGEVRKEAPIWMTKSTVINEATADSSDSVGGPALLIDEVMWSHFTITGNVTLISLSHRWKYQAILQKRTAIKRISCLF